MAEQAKKKASYEDLYDLPDNMIGEIINGDLIATPRPLYKHGNVASGLGMEIGPPYHYGRGGPGGWWILDEPEIHLGEHVLVPDLAGWRRERMPTLPETHWTDVPPDWVCEVLSPKSVRHDRVRKMPIYREFGVSHIWIVDPLSKALEIFRQESGRWVLLSSHGGIDKVRAEPFQDIVINLQDLWGESETQEEQT